MFSFEELVITNDYFTLLKSIQESFQSRITDYFASLVLLRYEPRNPLEEVKTHKYEF